MKQNWIMFVVEKALFFWLFNLVFGRSWLGQFACKITKYLKQISTDSANEFQFDLPNADLMQDTSLVIWFSTP